MQGILILVTKFSFDLILSLFLPSRTSTNVQNGGRKGRMEGTISETFPFDKIGSCPFGPDLLYSKQTMYFKRMTLNK